MFLALLLAATMAAPDLKGVLSLSSSVGFAHACPITPHYALTNAHVVDDKVEGLRWSDELGNWGVVDKVEADVYSDLALLHSERPFGRVFEVEHSAPTVGTRVWIASYNRDNKKEAYKDKVVSGPITRVFAGLILFDEDAGPGSSGGCVVNAEGKVLGINEGWVSISQTSFLGIAVGLWDGFDDVRKSIESTP